MRALPCMPAGICAHNDSPQRLIPQPLRQAFQPCFKDFCFKVTALPALPTSILLLTASAEQDAQEWHVTAGSLNTDVKPLLVSQQPI